MKYFEPIFDFYQSGNKIQRNEYLDLDFFLDELEFFKVTTRFKYGPIGKFLIFFIFQMTETIISKSSMDEKIPEDRNYSKTNIFTKLLFLLKNNNSEKIKKWKNKINHFVDAQDRFDQGSSDADGH